MSFHFVNLYKKKEIINLYSVFIPSGIFHAVISATAISPLANEKRGEKERREVGRGAPVKTGESIYFKRWVMNRCHSYLSATAFTVVCALHFTNVVFTVRLAYLTPPVLQNKPEDGAWPSPRFATPGPLAGTGCGATGPNDFNVAPLRMQAKTFPHISFFSFFSITRNDLKVKHPVVVLF